MSGDDTIFFSVEYEEKPEARESINKLREALGSETRKAMLRKIVRQPTTATVLADHLELSKPGVGKHLEILKEAGLIREAEMPEKKYKNEKYYEAAFPFLTTEDNQKLDAIMDRIAKAVGPTIKDYKKDIEETFRETTMAQRGGLLEDLTTHIRISLALRIQGQLELVKGKWALRNRDWFVIALERPDKSETVRMSQDHHLGSAGR